jgi:hypothetical protein
MALDFFDTLTAEDIIIVDDSHRSFPNSDVTVWFTEILPRLPSGILYAMHDIFLPMDYYERWSVNEHRWYNEQYLLCAYILGGGDQIIFPTNFLEKKPEIREAYKPLFGNDTLPARLWGDGAFFWMRK